MVVGASAMLAAVVVDHAVGPPPLRIAEVAEPQPAADEVLLQVLACGVCRTDLHIVEHELGEHKRDLIPGHQIVGRVVESASRPELVGTRVGVGWLASTDGTCVYCRSGRENLCDNFRRTGFDRDGGYAAFVTARPDAVIPLPDSLNDIATAPLLCAGAIGHRSMQVAGVEDGDSVGLYGFGSSARLLLPILLARGCTVYVATRAERHQQQALAMGVHWAGGAIDSPPVPLQRAITFAPSGRVVIAALAGLAKGGVVAINAVHLDSIPEFDYDHLLWGERQLRSVANVTRADIAGMLQLATTLNIQPSVRALPLTEANHALAKLERDETGESLVLIP